MFIPLMIYHIYLASKLLKNLKVAIDTYNHFLLKTNALCNKSPMLFQDANSLKSII